MKKTFSILLLTLFLFNVGGYYVVFWALRYQADQHLTSVLDSGNYTKTETIELKVPISMPYPLHPRGFERANGEFEINGEYFTLVEQKLQEDTLYIVMIRDYYEEDLVETMTEYANLSNDLPGAGQKTLNFLGKLLKEYHSGESITVIESSSGYARTDSYTDFSKNILTQVSDILSPPPRS